MQHNRLSRNCFLSLYGMNNQTWSPARPQEYITIIATLTPMQSRYSPLSGNKALLRTKPVVFFVKNNTLFCFQFCYSTVVLLRPPLIYFFTGRPWMYGKKSANAVENGVCQPLLNTKTHFLDLPCELEGMYFSFQFSGLRIKPNLFQECLNHRVKCNTAKRRNMNDDISFSTRQSLREARSLLCRANGLVSPGKRTDWKWDERVGNSSFSLALPQGELVQGTQSKPKLSIYPKKTFKRQGMSRKASVTTLWDIELWHLSCVLTRLSRGFTVFSSSLICSFQSQSGLQGRLLIHFDS